MVPSDFVDEKLIQNLDKHLKETKVFNPENNFIDQLILERVLGIRNPDAEKNKDDYQQRLVTHTSTKERFKSTFQVENRASHALLRQSNMRS